MTELASLTLEIRPRHHQEIPQWLGRATHAWFFESVAKVQKTLSEHLHDMNQIKPFTVSNLIGGKHKSGMVLINPKETYRLRITTLHADLTSILKHGLTTQWWRDGIRLHDQAFNIVNIHVDGDWNQQTLYEHLYAQASTSNRLKFQFGSPTAFKSDGKHTPFPLPELVFNSLWQRWQYFSNVDVNRDVLAYVREHVTVNHYKLQTHQARFDHTHRVDLIPGFTGEVQYYLGRDVEAIRILNALGHYSLFSGVGVRTAMGLGQSRVIAS